MDPFLSQKKVRRIKSLLFASLFLLFQVGFFGISTTRVYAGIDPGITKIDIPRKFAEVEDKVSKSLLSSVLGSLVNMTSYFMRTLAYDTATYIASGGKGQGSLIFEKPFDEYLAGVATDSVGEAIHSLGQGFGVNLCAPPDLRLQAQLKMGLDRTYNPVSAAGKSLGNTAGTSASGPQASCSWQQIKNNWKDGIDVGVDINVAAEFASEVNVLETDFGYALGAFQQLDSLKSAQKEAASLEALVGNGFKSVTDLVSGHVNTPAKQIEEETKTLTGKHQGELSSQQISGIYASGLWQVIPTAASVFLNTLTSQLLNRLFTDGLVPSEKERGQGVADFYAINSVISQRQVAQRAFSFLTAKTGSKNPSEYDDILASYSVCPNNPGLNNCVMNPEMKKAIDRALIGKPLTLYAAVFEEGFIPPNTPLISPRRTADNESLDCYKDNLCYSNIQKMRKARILPLGMEIAAQRSDPDSPWTIGEVLQGFEKCPTPNQDGTITPDITNFPFCHLVNPNWILRAPDTRCENRVYSPELLVPESPRRQEACVDISTCITEDENGNCIDDKYYGFCTQEKNVWFFPGDTCEEEFSSCKTYTNQETSTVVSYLSRTLEYGSCNASAVGCLPYVTEQQPATSTWVGTKDIQLANKLFGASQVLYLNERVTQQGNSCPEGADGCSSFIGASRNSTTGAYQEDSGGGYIQDATRVRNIKKAPNYLGCYDTTFTSASPEVQYPTTPLELASITDDSRCDAYASVCLPEEVGCESYTPAGSGETIPGVVGDNFCPESCVGYDTFRQEETNFEAGVYPLYFIPDKGTPCSAQHVGCDEFTNIDAVTEGGEQLEYYTYIKQCEEPSGDNSSVYYSWEGSESTGFVLRVHTLAKVGTDVQFIPSSLLSDFSAVSPAYADDSSTNLVENDTLCNETLYRNVIQNTPDVVHADPDCRALYDTKGTVYYRLLAETVTVSSACHPIRKTESRLVASVDILTANTCLQKNGYWDGTSCQVCYGGGEWVSQSGDATKGSCVYYAIDAPGESVSCPAVANECRAYTGNAGNNVRPVFETGIDSFEPVGEGADSLSQAKASWGPAEQVSIAAESLQVTANSLRINGGAGANTITRTIAGDAIESGAAYELTFWARGIAQNLSISLRQGSKTWSLTTDPLTNTDLPISISQTWRAYTVGPVLFTTGQAGVPLDLVFARSGGSAEGVYFLDNVSLQRTNGSTYVLRDSWKSPEGYDAPSECFASSQNPRGAFPGAALGCNAYTTSLGQRVYATGFERLCREKAVGCAPLWDTFNSASSDAEVYNARCVSGTLGSKRYSHSKPATEVTTCSVTVDSSEYSCAIGVGESSCVIAGPIRIPSEDFITPLSDPGQNILVIKESSVTALRFDIPGFFAIVDSSSVYIPADTAVESPVYLTDTPEYACKDTYLGCQVTGLEEQHTPDKQSSVSYTYTNQGILNLPAKYVGEQGILCTQEQVACSAYTTSEGSTSYFKDPSVNANKLCVYQASQSNDAESPEGWFLKSVGQCSQDDTILCDTDTACGAGNTCVDIGKAEPCYPTYQTGFDAYGLWSNGSDQYTGYVGECPATQNLCTELVDPYDVDTSGRNPDGKPYYVIYDERVTGSSDECGGQASLREGCVLFDNTNVPTKSYDTNATYKASENKASKGDQNTLVARVSNPSSNDANVLLKVNRNRECSEWLACESYEPIQTGDGKQIFACESFGRCISFDGTGCSAWAPDNGSNNPEDSFLDMKAYISRDTSWNGFEYTGYALADRYNISDLDTVSISSQDPDNSYLGYILSDAYLASNDGQNCLTLGTGSSCGINGEGRCIELDCVVPMNGKFASNDIDLSRIATALGKAECKVPPEQESPFSFDVIETIQERDVHGFAQDGVSTDLVRYTFSTRPADLNVCQGGDCTCNYVKVSYGSLVKDYWASDTYHKKSSELNAWGICTGASDTEGEYCAEDSDCGTLGRCQKIDRIETQIGSTGHCLEYDLSRPIYEKNGKKTFACLTWYPSDKSFGKLDNYNLFTEAGYAPYIDAIAPDGGAAGKVFCTESFGRGGGSYEGTLRVLPRFGGTINNNVIIRDARLVQLAVRNQVTPEINNCIPVKLIDIFPGKEDDRILLSTTHHPSLADGTIQGSLSCSNNNAGSHSDTFYFENNPYLWYVCGVSKADEELEQGCGLSGSPYSKESAMDALYSLMSLLGWTYLDPNAVVLRVEGHDVFVDNDNNFGYYPPTGGSGLKQMGALVPDPYDADSGTDDGHDTKTLLHPPRFGVEGSTFIAHMKTSSGGDINVNTQCHVAGGCSALEDETLVRSTETEKYLNLESLKAVYFLPLSIPDGANGIVPPLLSTELKLDFESKKTTLKSALENQHTGANIRDGASRDNGGVTISTYTLLRDKSSDKPCEGLISFCEYTSAEQVVSNYDGLTQQVQYTLGGSLDPNEVERNEIATRKVLVYYSSNSSGGAPFALASPGGSFVEATSRDTDPFTSDCKVSASNFIAIGMDFNKNGEFLGYISRHCHSYTESHGLQLATIAVLRDQCSEFATVYRDVSPTEESNKAWTNRVWNMSRYTLKNVADTTEVIGQKTPRAPFGSSQLTHTDLVNAKTSDTAKTSLLQYAFNNPIFGYPLYCYPLSVNTTFKVFARDDRCSTLLGDGFNQNEVGAINTWSKSASLTGEKVLSRLFATYYAYARFPFDEAHIITKEDDETGYRPYADDARGENYADFVDNMNLIVPQIYSLNIETCFPNDTATNCTPAEKNAFTIGENNGDTAIISKNSYTARASFFAFADDNRMPIRRVMVNWGDDNITNKDVKGFYKNRKPFCEPSNDVGPETTLGYCRNEISQELTLLTCKEHEDCPSDGLIYSCVQVGEDSYVPPTAPRQINIFEDLTIVVDEQISLNSLAAFTALGGEEFFVAFASAGGITYNSESTNSGIVQIVNRGGGYGLLDFTGLAVGTTNIQVTITNASGGSRTADFQITVVGDYNLYFIDRKLAEVNEYPALSIYDSFVQPRFGNLPRACEAEPFEYYHTYGCKIGSEAQTTVGGSSLIDVTTQAKLRARGLTNDSPVCVYQPKVQVLDNWGWCNGSCGQLSSNNSTGCYSGITNRCDPERQEPWTSYVGKIIVIP